MILAIVKAILLFAALLFGFVAFARAYRGLDVSADQNIVWAACLTVFITLQWLLP
jgi:predicted membrane protein